MGDAVFLYVANEGRIKEVIGMLGWVMRQRAMLNGNSLIERRVANELDSHRISFKRNWPLKVKTGRWVFLDFYFPEAELIVELDGKEHRQWKDRGRDERILDVLGTHEILHFRNKQIKGRFHDVMEMILAKVEKKTYVPNLYDFIFMDQVIEQQDEHLMAIAKYG